MRGLCAGRDARRCTPQMSDLAGSPAPVPPDYALRSRVQLPGHHGPPADPRRRCAAQDVALPALCGAGRSPRTPPRLHARRAATKGSFSCLICGHGTIACLSNAIESLRLRTAQICVAHVRNMGLLDLTGIWQLVPVTPFPNSKQSVHVGRQQARLHTAEEAEEEHHRRNGQAEGGKSRGSSMYYEHRQADRAGCLAERRGSVSFRSPEQSQ